MSARPEIPEGLMPGLTADASDLMNYRWRGGFRLVGPPWRIGRGTLFIPDREPERNAEGEVMAWRFRSVGRGETRTAYVFNG